MSNINKIKVSGQTYDIQDPNASKTVELTQAQYDALTVKDPNTFYVITDAQGADLSNYYTKSETSGATEISTALNAKQDTLVSGTNIKTINNESILGSGNIEIQGGGGKAVIGGTNISVTTGETADTINCTLPITADTDGSVNEFLVGNNNTIGSDTNKNIVIGDNNTTFGQGGSRHYSGATIIGYNNNVGCFGIQNDRNDWSSVIGRRNKVNGGNSYIIGVDNNFYNFTSKKNYHYIIGVGNDESSINTDTQNVFVFGAYNKITKSDEFALGKYNTSSSDGTTSGNTFFAIGNGTAENARHNAFEIRQNGDIYLTKDGQDVKLQDQLGGGGGGITSGEVQTMIDESVSGKANSSDSTYSVNANIQNDGIYFTTLNKDGNQIDYSFEPQIRFQAPLYSDYNDGKVKISGVTAVTSASTDSEIPTAKAVNDKLGGLSLVKLTQAQYDALSPNYDSNTLYVVTDS